MPAAKDSRENQRAQLLLQEYAARLQSQLQAVEADLADLCRAAWAAGPGPGTPMSQVLDRQEEDVIVPELDLASAPLPPTEHVVDEGAAPEGTSYEIMLQVRPCLCTEYQPQLPALIYARDLL